MSILVSCHAPYMRDDLVHYQSPPHSHELKMLIEQICKYLVSEIVREDRSASLRRVCTLLAQLEPIKGQSPTSGTCIAIFCSLTVPQHSIYLSSQQQIPNLSF
jgi:hypothetical protein